MGGRRAGELPQGARRERASFTGGLDALSRVLTRLTSRWPLGRVDQTDRGEAGRVAERSLTYAPIGVLFEVWLPMRKKRSGSLPAFQEGAGVAVTLRAERLGWNPERFRSLQRGWWGKGAFGLMGSFQLLSSA